MSEYDNTYTTIRATIAFDSIWIAFSIIGAGVALVVSRKQKHRSNDRSWLLVILLGLFGFLLANVFELAQQAASYQAEISDDTEGDWQPSTYAVIIVLSNFWYIVADICLAWLFFHTLIQRSRAVKTVGLIGLLIFILLSLVEFALNIWSQVEQFLADTHPQSDSFGGDGGDPYNNSYESAAEKAGLKSEELYLTKTSYAIIYFTAFFIAAISLNRAGTSNMKSAVGLLILAVILIDLSNIFSIAESASFLNVTIAWQADLALDIVSQTCYILSYWAMAGLGSVQAASFAFST